MSTVPSAEIGTLQPQNYFGIKKAKLSSGELKTQALEIKLLTELQINWFSAKV